MDITVLGIDLGKNSCSLIGLDGSGKVPLRRRMQRKTITVLAAKLSPCIVAMEACCGAHHLGRVLAAQGHSVRLMSPEYVRPYVKAQKNDDRDAEAIAEAARADDPLEAGDGAFGSLAHQRFEFTERQFDWIEVGRIFGQIFDLHVPPALTVRLLPFLIQNPGYQFPIAIGVGTLLLTMCFLAWRETRAILQQ